PGRYLPLRRRQLQPGLAGGPARAGNAARQADGAVARRGEPGGQRRAPWRAAAGPAPARQRRLLAAGRGRRRPRPASRPRRTRAPTLRARRQPGRQRPGPGHRRAGGAPAWRQPRAASQPRTVAGTDRQAAPAPGLTSARPPRYRMGTPMFRFFLLIALILPAAPVPATGTVILFVHGGGWA